MTALETYVKQHGYNKAVELLQANIFEENNADLKLFYSNALRRLPAYKAHMEAAHGSQNR